MGLKSLLQARFHRVKPCKNPDYAMLQFFTPEYFKGTEVIPDEPNLSILLNVNKDKDARFLQAFEVSKNYNLVCDARVQKARESYPAKLDIKIVDFKPA